MVGTSGLEPLTFPASRDALKTKMVGTSGLEPLTFPASRDALKTKMVGTSGLEPLTSSVSRKRSNQLSYAPTATTCGGTEQSLL